MRLVLTKHLTYVNRLVVMRTINTEVVERRTRIELIIVHSFIHSGHFYSAPSSPLLLRGAPDYSTDTVSEFRSAQATVQNVSKGLAQGPYVAARAGVEPTTLRLKVIVSTNAPPRLTIV